jgi:hypothetical protein
MATKIPKWEPNKKKVYFKMKKGEKYTEYVAVYEGLEIRGRTVGEKNEIKDVVRRIILAESEPPEGVLKAAIGVASYVASTVTTNTRAEEVWGVVAVEIGLGDRLRLSVVLYQHADNNTDESGWAGEVSAEFAGNDGLIDKAIHKVIKWMDFGEEVDIMALYRELLRVSRHAYNALNTY